MRFIFSAYCFTAAVVLQAQLGTASVPRPTFGVAKSASMIPQETLLLMRGGASKSKRKPVTKASSNKTATGRKKVGAAAEAEKAKKSALSDTFTKYKAILPLTRIYITMVGVSTLLGLILGDELTQGLLAFNPTRVLCGEVWRPLTAASFLGPPSIGWLMNGYYLFEYGSSLERTYGIAQHFVFLCTQITILSIMSGLLGMPFFAQSVITSMLYVLSRAMPNMKVKWLIITVPYWFLPYGLMIGDVLQAGNAMAATPHVLGILSGHFYHFHKFIWPKIGGEDWLTAPDILMRALDPSTRAAKESVNKALKAKKRGKGRKLGSSK